MFDSFPVPGAWHTEWDDNPDAVYQNGEISLLEK